MDAKGYYCSLDAFRQFAGCDTFEELLGILNPRDQILKWRESMEISPSSQNAYVSRVKSFYDYSTGQWAESSGTGRGC